MTDFFKREPDYQVSEVKRMREMFESGRLSRRHFLQGMVAAGLSASTAAAVITGSRDVQAATPKRGGVVRMAAAQHGPDDSLDPLLWKETLGYTRGRTHYNGLVQFNDDLTLRPELAKSWEVNSNATEFTFELERGVTFHDGKDLTADDVIYSMGLHMGEDSVSISKALVTMVREWKKLDSHTVRATLDTPNADLPAILGTFSFKIVQEGAHQMEGYFNKGIGTGPFMVEEFSPGIICRSKRNPNYFREGMPYADEVQTFGIGDPIARVNALLSNEIELAARIDRKAVPQIEESDNADVFSVVSNRFTELVLDLTKHPGNNPDFVLAMKHLMPRKAMLRKILKGQGALGNDHPVGPTFDMHCESLALREQDLDKAKFHLQKSGITEAQVDTSDAAVGGIDMCILAQAEAQKIGLNLKVNRTASDGYWGAVYRKTPFFMSTWSPPADGKHDAAPHRPLGGGVQRIAIQERAGGRASRCDPRGDGRGQAQGDVLRNPDHRLQRSGEHHSLAPGHRRRHLDQGEGHAASGAQQPRRLRVAGVRLARRLREGPKYQSGLHTPSGCGPGRILTRGNILPLSASEVTSEQVSTFRADGAVCLRGHPGARVAGTPVGSLRRGDEQAPQGPGAALLPAHRALARGAGL